MDNKVALVGCESYDRQLVEEKIGYAFELLGGVDKVVREGESVFLKLNLLVPTAPEKGVTTHPEVVRAVVNQLKPVAGRITLGDSPGGLFTESWLKRVYDKTGMARVAEETGASLNFDFSVMQKTVSDTKTMKSFTLSGAMTSADRLISLSKLKTHLLMNVTAAIKNIFGAVPGMNKVIYHARHKSAESFADLLVDVALAVEVDLHLVDAVVSMDGNGPQHGNLKETGILAAGRDAFVVDTALMDLIGFSPESNRALGSAIARGLATGDAGKIGMVGDDPESLKIEGFQLPYKKDITSRIPGFLLNWYGEWMSLRPRPDPDKCTGCRKCVDICPAGAITISERMAVIDDTACFRCYCCHELCEHDAIELERPLLLRLANRIGG